MALNTSIVSSEPLRNNALLWFARTNWNSGTGSYHQAPQTMGTGAGGLGYPVQPYQVTRFNPYRSHNIQYYTLVNTFTGLPFNTNAPLIAYNDSSFLGQGTTRYRYRINYDAILYWLKNKDGVSGNNPFPPIMRAGGVLYYDAIPDTITNPIGNMPTATQAQRNQRFWKEYIDYVLGLYETTGSKGDPELGTGSRSYTTTIQQIAGYGWDTGIDESAATGSMPFALSGANQVVINPTPNIPDPQGRYPLTTYPSYVTDPRYMDYRDSPMRPKTRYWFGPVTMLDFIDNYNNDTYVNAAGQTGPRYWMPGTVHQAPMWQLKVGVQTVIGDVRNNHPNDYLAVVAFSVPAYNNGPSGGTNAVVGGYFNKVLSPLSPLFNSNYTRMKNALWFPSKVINTTPYAEITPFDSAGIATVPRAVKGTDSPMAFALAYNQLSGEPSLKNFNPSPAPDYEAGGNGRNGAQRLIIFETDGVASATAFLLGTESTSAHLVRNQNKSYFKVRWRDTGGAPRYPDGVYGPVADAVTQTRNDV